MRFSFRKNFGLKSLKIFHAMRNFTANLMFSVFNSVPRNVLARKGCFFYTPYELKVSR